MYSYFNDNADWVETKYFDSAFLKQSNSSNLDVKLLQSLFTINLGKLIQISMDGLNVNLYVLNFYSKYREKNELSELINIVSCGMM